MCYVSLLTFPILNTALRIGAKNLGLLISTTLPRYLLQQRIPRMITTIASILVIHIVGQQQAITQPTPNAIHK